MENRSHGSDFAEESQFIFHDVKKAAAFKMASTCIISDHALSIQIYQSPQSSREEEEKQKFNFYINNVKINNLSIIKHQENIIYKSFYSSLNYFDFLQPIKLLFLTS